MNILLIDHYVGGGSYGMEYRPYYLGREWVKQGHSVTFVGGSFSHLRLQQPNVTNDFDEENISGIKYIWLKLPAYNSNRSRICNMIQFVWKLKKYAKQIATIVCPDIVIASSTYPLDIYPARTIAELASAILCYEVHYLCPLCPMIIGGYSRWHPFIVVMQMAENYAYKYSHKVVSLLWNAKEHMVEHGMKINKFVCIPNGYCAEEWSGINIELPQEHSSLFEKLKNEKKIIVGFSGGFAPSGSLDTLINAAIILRDCRQIAFVLVGKGISEEKLRAEVNDHMLENVFFLSPVSKDLVPSVISNFDIAYMGGIHSKLHYYGTSYNKLTDYMLASKPIILSIDEPNNLAERVGCGFRVEAENAAAVAKVILELIAMSERDREEMGKRGSVYARQNLEYGFLAEKFLEKVTS